MIWLVYFIGAIVSSFVFLVIFWLFIAIGVSWQEFYEEQKRLRRK
jgi:hypothetical protein